MTDLTQKAEDTGMISKATDVLIAAMVEDTGMIGRATVELALLDSKLHAMIKVGSGWWAVEIPKDVVTRMLFEAGATEGQLNFGL